MNRPSLLKVKSILKYCFKISDTMDTCPELNEGAGDDDKFQVITVRRRRRRISSSSVERDIY